MPLRSGLQRRRVNFVRSVGRQYLRHIFHLPHLPCAQPDHHTGLSLTDSRPVDSSRHRPAFRGKACSVTTGGFAGPTGFVTFADNGTAFSTVALAAGEATATRTWPTPGNHVITATYEGDSDDSTSVGALTTEIPWFTRVSGAATSIGEGADGAIWVTGTNPVSGGYGIYRWTGTGWAGIPGGATAIAVGPDGNPWVINSSHRVYQRIGGQWTLRPRDGYLDRRGRRRGDMGDGHQLRLGRLRHLPLDGTGWAGIPGGAIAIAVGPDGNPWVINSSHRIYQRSGGQWALRPGAATSIGEGADAAVWVTGTKSVWAATAFTAGPVRGGWAFPAGPPPSRSDPTATPG